MLDGGIFRGGEDADSDDSFGDSTWGFGDPDEGFSAESLFTAAGEWWVDCVAIVNELPGVCASWRARGEGVDAEDLLETLLTRCLEGHTGLFEPAVVTSHLVSRRN